MKTLAELREQLVAAMDKKKLLNEKRSEVRARIDKDVARLSSIENDILGEEQRIKALATSMVEAAQREKADTAS